ncbi:MAG: alpha/beta hydrolase [Dehalococcoidia bacterium]
MDAATFERERLSLFARYGFEGESRWTSDREGRSTYMLSRGEGPCPTMLVHGGLSHASEWALMAGKLPGHVIIPDRPGCGLSYAIDYLGVDYRKAAADWLLNVVNGIGTDQVDLVANSMGGFFSLAFAIAHPNRVRHLVLVGAPAGLDKKLPLFIRLWGNPITGPIISKQGIRDTETPSGSSRRSSWHTPKKCRWTTSRSWWQAWRFQALPAPRTQC